MIFVAYYTPGRYEEYLPACVASLARWGLQYDVERVADLGSWQANTHFKAEFLDRKLREHRGEPLVYLDVDAVVEAKPTLFESILADVGVYYHGPCPGKTPGVDEWRLFNGTIYLRNNWISGEIVRAWRDENRWSPLTTDQENLDRAIRSRLAARKPIQVQRLPAGYCWVEEVMRGVYPEEPVVIRHFMESRATRIPGWKRTGRP